ncbi:phospho-N-acetylmuramoyl-pentapeptide-transferase [Longispora albida]|uniref:phospho-N-acetylmuramoyl-pentapeptide- transferase n=1 Tax=Longispora albida TaxID=203523 RepID=UPI00037BD9F8|nr:phospho-N-acetylmuramoyl-pentapeptide-transferase [Longispora albida]
MRAVVAAAFVAFVLSLLVTPVAARALRALKAGQPIRDLGTVTHTEKRGMPTMGGLIFIAATLIAYAAGHLVLAGMPDRAARPAGITVTGVVLLGLLVWCGAVGFLDDWIKVRKRDPRGLSKRGKLIGQISAGVVLGWVALGFPRTINGHALTVGSEYLSLVRDIGWLKIGTALSIAVFVFVIMSMSNAVNLADGLDGLATGATALVLLAYSLIGFWQYRHWCPEYPASRAGDYCYTTRDPLEIALIAAAAAGALLGFLWWNTSPGRIIMGDTGALGLGGLLGGMAIATKTVLLTPILGALFVIIMMSVVLQIISLRGFGRRIFLISPLHHHFEKKGWSEVNIVVRFWIVAAIGVLAALGIFYYDFSQAYR